LNLQAAPGGLNDKRLAYRKPGVSVLKKIFRAIRRKCVHLYERGLQMIKGIQIALADLPQKGIHVFYGYDRLPTKGDVARGGIIKFQGLSNIFPNIPKRFNILYLVSSHYPPHAKQLYRWARRKGVKFLWNQDGIAYPASYPLGWQQTNARLAEFLHNADYVFYQSHFSRSSCDRFLGRRNGPSEILYNAVDTDFFHPSTAKQASRDLVLLTAGSKSRFHRIEIPIRTLACLRRTCPRTHLLFAGKIWDELIHPTKRLVDELGLADHITFLPPFTQDEAPDIYRRGDIFLHPKINDPCPGVVIEAMACGLPVVYSDSGGVPELVGQEAGLGVPTEADWKKFISPDPEKWAESVLKIAQKRAQHAEAARQRASEHFNLCAWVQRHREVFTALLEGKRASLPETIGTEVVEDA
jgi:glycosyltransferase involved in cell wall biosynthesis